MDINQLLASEQVSLLRAQFATLASVRDRYLAVAADLTESLGLSLYPHRPLAQALLA